MTKICHLSAANPEGPVFCHEGCPGTERGPYNINREPFQCSAWNEVSQICNLVLLPTVVVNNVTESGRHNCNCENSAEE